MYAPICTVLHGAKAHENHLPPQVWSLTNCSTLGAVQYVSLFRLRGNYWSLWRLVMPRFLFLNNFLFLKLILQNFKNLALKCSQLRERKELLRLEIPWIYRNPLSFSNLFYSVFHDAGDEMTRVFWKSIKDKVAVQQSSLLVHVS